jgi:hypothetical protein
MSRPSTGIPVSNSNKIELFLMLLLCNKPTTTTIKTTIKTITAIFFSERRRE